MSFFQPHPNVVALPDDCGQKYTEIDSRDGSYTVRCVLQKGHGGPHCCWQDPLTRRLRQERARLGR